MKVKALLLLLNPTTDLNTLWICRYGLADNEDNIPDIIKVGALQRLVDCGEKLSVQASKVGVLSVEVEVFKLNGFLCTLKLSEGFFKGKWMGHAWELFKGNARHLRDHNQPVHCMCSASEFINLRPHIGKELRSKVITRCVLSNTHVPAGLRPKNHQPHGAEAEQQCPRPEPCGVHAAVCAPSGECML